jgi:hypothetical protein
MARIVSKADESFLVTDMAVVNLREITVLKRRMKEPSGFCLVIYTTLDRKVVLRGDEAADVWDMLTDGPAI